VHYVDRPRRIAEFDSDPLRARPVHGRRVRDAEEQALRDAIDASRAGQVPMGPEHRSATSEPRDGCADPGGGPLRVPEEHERVVVAEEGPPDDPGLPEAVVEELQGAGPRETDTRPEDGGPDLAIRVRRAAREIEPELRVVGERFHDGAAVMREE